MFLSLIVSIYGFIKSALPVRKAIVDDYPFKLCYIFTAALLFFFTSLLGLKDAFSKYFFTLYLWTNAKINPFLQTFNTLGDNIICYAKGNDEQQQKAIQQYCWVSGTTMKRSSSECPT